LELETWNLKPDPASVKKKTMSELDMYEPTWNTGALYGGDWPSATSVLARQVSTFSLILIGAVLLILVLMALASLRSKHRAAPEAPAARPAPGGAYALAAPAVSPFGPVQEVALNLAPAASTVPVALQAGQPEPPAAPLSPTDLIALAALRSRVQNGQVSEGATTAERLAFARWLAEHGKLTS
jgi:hypothetical protein